MRSWYSLTDNLPPACGAKAYNLSLLARAGIATPKGSAIPYTTSMSTQLIRQATAELSYPLIIRSSSTLEDNSLHSLAGVFSSEIARSQQEVAPAIEKIHRHSLSKSVHQLLAQHNISAETIQVSYLLQEYTISCRGGVMIVPDDPQASIRVETGDTPEQVTAGQVTPQLDEISPQQQVNLDKPWLVSLQQAADQIRTVFTGPQDVEWLETGQGELYILQSRPYLQKGTLLQTDHLTTDTLPDIDAPTPLTLSLLQDIYTQGIAIRFGLRKQLDPALFFPVIDGQLYCDTAAIGGLLKPPMRNLLPRLRYFKRRLSLLTAMAHYKPLPAPTSPDDNTSLAELCKHVTYQLGPAIFKTTDQLQIVRGQLQKKLHITADDVLLRDTSRTPLQLAAPQLSDEELVHRFWYLGGNEYELSGQRFSEQGPIAAVRLRELAKSASDARIIAAKRAENLENYLSIFDIAYRKNLFVLYDQLLQQRADLHDQLIYAMATLRRQLLKIDARLQLDGTIWYAQLTEIMESTVPNRKVLQIRKNHWQTLQSLPLYTSDTVDPADQSARQVLHGTELSPGHASGTICTDLQHHHPTRRSILVTRSLSHEIIIKRDTFAGVIVERGGALSHVAILAREHDLPIIRTTEPVQTFHEGDTATIDTTADTIIISA